MRQTLGRWGVDRQLAPDWPASDGDLQPTEALALPAWVHDMGLGSDGMRRRLRPVQMRFKLAAVAAVAA